MIKVIFSALALLLLLRATEQLKPGTGTQCVVPEKPSDCKAHTDCTGLSSCVRKTESESGTCFPVCAGILGTPCARQCCYLQEDGTYTTSMPPFMSDAQGVCF